MADIVMSGMWLLLAGVVVLVQICLYYIYGAFMIFSILIVIGFLLMSLAEFIGWCTTKVVAQ